MTLAPHVWEGARWERLRFKDHFLNVSRKDISADVPMRLNVGAVGPPDGIGRDFRDYRPSGRSFHVPRTQQPNEGLGKVLTFNNDGMLVLPQGGHKLRSARDPHGRWR